MTIPYQMNCPHDGFGWCLNCVKSLADDLAAKGVEIAGLRASIEGHRIITEQVHAPLSFSDEGISALTSELRLARETLANQKTWLSRIERDRGERDKVFAQCVTARSEIVAVELSLASRPATEGGTK